MLCRVLVSTIALLMFAIPDANAQRAVLFKVNGAATQPTSINSLGQVAGFEGSFSVHGFIRDSTGAVTTFDAPGSTLTYPNGINDSGDVTGEFIDPSNVQHGFVRDSAGMITPFDPPNSTYTSATAINSAGQITGFYSDQNNLTHGFLRDSSGAITSFDASSDSTQTIPHAINATGQITGYYLASHSIGFIRQPSGALATFNVPGASGTQGLAINQAGQIAGNYVDANDNQMHGFLRLAGGRLIPFDPPTSIDTETAGINSRTQIVGSYEPQVLGGYSFLRQPTGKIFSIDTLPGAFQPTAVAINDTGQITGWCFPSGGGSSAGFVLDPPH